LKKSGEEDRISDALRKEFEIVPKIVPVKKKKRGKK